jgi:hypothetical protein
MTTFWVVKKVYGLGGENWLEFVAEFPDQDDAQSYADQLSDVWPTELFLVKEY